MENDNNAPPTGKDDRKPGKRPGTKRHKIEVENLNDVKKPGEKPGMKRHNIEVENDDNMPQARKEARNQAPQDLDGQ